MNIRRTISNYFDMLVDARFKTNADGRLIFYPYGFGAGRFVSDSECERMLRLQSRRILLGVFLVLVPIVSIAGMFAQFKGINYWIVFGPAVSIAFATNIYLDVISRHLPRANDRLSYMKAATLSLDNFGMNFLKFGLISSILFVTVSLILLVIPAARAEMDPISVAISIVVFTPMIWIYARAIARRKKAAAGA